MKQVNPRIFSSILIILFLLITIGTVYSISMETQRALKGAVQDKIIAVASTTASQIDGNTFARIQPGDEGTVVFIRIRDQLHSAKLATPDIRYIYTMRQSGDVVVFVVDGDYGFDPDTPAIGEPYPGPEAAMLDGFSAPTADQEFTTDKWGTVLSGFAPIRDRAGNVVGIVGVDMDSSVVNKELEYLNIILYFVGIIAMISVVIGIMVIERRRALDEQKIMESEEKYRLLFERAGDAIFLLEAEGAGLGTIISMNRTAEEMYGYTPGELRMMNINDLSSPEEKEKNADYYNRILDGVWLQGETTHCRRDGSLFPVEFSAGLLNLGTKKLFFAIFRDITERKKADDALYQVTRKLNLLNTVTFNDIQNASFTLNGFLALSKTFSDTENIQRSLSKTDDAVRRISNSLDFAKSYQDLGAKPPRWHDVNQAFILGISHLDFSGIQRNVQLDNLEIFADSLFERVFYTLADNVLRHAGNATLVTLGYQMSKENLLLFFSDNGPGVADDQKEKIFERGYGTQKGMELFLVREILGITGITIHENGVFGSGARFEIIIPRGGYRFPRAKTD